VWADQRHQAHSGPHEELAVQTFRGARWALVIDLVLLAGFVIVVGGSLWELGHVDPSKAAQLRAMGFDPSFAVGFQLGYSVAGVALRRSPRSLTAQLATPSP